MPNITATVTTPTAKKQITCGIRQEEKDLVKLFGLELTRPAAVKDAAPVGASEKEIVEIMAKIATDCRFYHELVSEADIAENPATGELVEVPAVYKLVDRFEQEWELIKSRDYSTPGVRVNSQVATLQSKLAEAEAKLAAMMAAMASSVPA